MAYLALMFVTDLLSDYIGYKWGNNFIMLHIYSLTELGFMIYLYQKVMFRKRHLPLLILGILGLVYITAEIALLYVFNQIVVKDFQPYAKVVDNFIIILMALAYMQERMNRFREQQWGNFRLNMAFLVYFTVNTVFFLPFNFMVNASSDVKFYFWTGHVSLLILLYSYLGFKMLKIPSKAMLA
ncbi:hypothetical protein [Flavobacterium akiainvivens]|nr:hypothetical protein [Flavobacterium akiainvivens]SFQ27134.1 hypothetical protein SAMN05444144_102288 [Flavobacterium akiainvivens]